MGSGEFRRHIVFCLSRPSTVITPEGNSLRIEFLPGNSVQNSGIAVMFFTGMHNDSMIFGMEDN